MERNASKKKTKKIMKRNESKKKEGENLRKKQIKKKQIKKQKKHDSVLVKRKPPRGAAQKDVLQQLRSKK